jgi:hypothetical protein
MGPFSLKEEERDPERMLGAPSLAGCLGHGASWAETSIQTLRENKVPLGAQGLQKGESRRRG